MISNNWLIENLNAEIEKFDGSAYVLPKHQNAAFKSCCALLSGNDQATNLSKARLRARGQARTSLRDIFLGVGPEVFLLCCISTSISRLATLSKLSLVPDLRKWWREASRPKGLVDSAKELCKTHSIPALVAGTGEGLLESAGELAIRANRLHQ